MGPRAVTERARALALEAAGPLGRRHPALLGLGLATLVFLAAPLAVVVPISFSAAKYLTFPPPGWSLQWYARYFGSREWMSATVRSFEVALLTTLTATSVGTAAALALRRPFRGRSLAQLVILAPMVVPVIIVAIGVYGLYAKLRMVGTLHGLVLAHTVLALPFVVVVVSATLSGFDQTLELAAQNLGANRWNTFRHVTLPLIRPVIGFQLIMATIGTLTMFTEPYMLTDGGPGYSSLTPVLYLYRSAFKFFKLGYGAGIAFLTFILILIPSTIQVRLYAERDRSYTAT